MTKLPTTGKERRARRHRRIRATLQGSAGRPRLSVFRSNQHVYVQLIDDVSGKTLIGISTRSLTKTGGEKVRGIDKVKKIGEQLAEKAQAQGITAAVFDRGGYPYHGRVAAIAEGARSKGLKL